MYSFLRPLHFRASCFEDLVGLLSAEALRIFCLPCFFVFLCLTSFVLAVTSEMLDLAGSCFVDYL